MTNSKRSIVRSVMSLAVICLITACAILLIKHKIGFPIGQATETEIAIGLGQASRTPTRAASVTAEVEAQAKPTSTLKSIPTRIATHTDNDFVPVETIDVTQIPPIVQSQAEQDATYLYEDVLVTLSFNLATSYRTLAKAYLNLDDLENNGFTNSDVMIFASTGSGGTTFGLAPVNLAIDYPGQAEMDYASCVDHLNEFGNYDGPETRMPYCVRTDEGRIGIIQYVPGSDQVDDVVWKRSYRVTVYAQEISEK